MNNELLYQKIGEFVVSFQFIEHRVREIGWLINDPERKVWPPTELREDSNSQLLTKVENLYVDFLNASQLVHKEKLILAFRNMIKTLHEYRKYRNNLLHSAYIEIKGGGELKEILRSNPKIKQIDEKSFFDTEVLTAEKFDQVLYKMALDAVELNGFYIQALHMVEFD